MLNGALSERCLPGHLQSALLDGQRAARQLTAAQLQGATNLQPLHRADQGYVCWSAYPTHTFDVTTLPDGCWSLTPSHTAITTLCSPAEQTVRPGCIDTPLLAREPTDTIADLSGLWTESPRWIDGSKHAYSFNTRNEYKKKLRQIEGLWGRSTLAQFDDPHIYSSLLEVQGRFEREGKLKPADNLFAVLSSMLSFGVSLKLLANNFALGIPDLYPGGRRAGFVWQRSQVERFVSMADILGYPTVGDAVWLGFETGFRRQDLLTAHDGNIRQHDFHKRALKLSRYGNSLCATIPRSHDLDRILARCQSRHRAPGVDNLLVTNDGLPFLEYQLEGLFGLIRKVSGIFYLDEKNGREEVLHFHDLRGTFATRLITTTDLSDREIAECMAWSPAWVARIRRVYVDDLTTIEAMGRRLQGLSVQGAPQ